MVYTGGIVTGGMSGGILTRGHNARGIIVRLPKYYSTMPCHKERYKIMSGFHAPRYHARIVIYVIMMV